MSKKLQLFITVGAYNLGYYQRVCTRRCTQINTIYPIQRSPIFFADDFETLLAYYVPHNKVPAKLHQHAKTPKVRTVAKHMHCRVLAPLNAPLPFIETAVAKHTRCQYHDD